MKPIKQVIFLLFSLFVISNMTGCSDETAQATANTQKNSGDHIWKQQTDTLQDTKDAAKKMQDSLNQQQQNIDDSH